METGTITSDRLAASVIAVPPLARDASGKICSQQNRRMIQYLEQGGVTSLLYGGNAVLYHIRPSEYRQLLEMLTESVSDKTWVVPSVGPAFGVMLDQAEILCDFDFPTAMILPQQEVVDPCGAATGVRRFAERWGKPIVLYIKHASWLTADLVGRLVRDGLISWIKYAVVRENPAHDDYLRDILSSVPANIVVSGIGEQPAIVHLNDFGVISYTSGCVCLAPGRSMQMLRAVQTGDLKTAESIRQQFQPLEDLRNKIHPIRVLHYAVAAAGISQTGPIQPLLSDLSDEQAAMVHAAAIQLSSL